MQNVPFNFELRASSVKKVIGIIAILNLLFLAGTWLRLQNEGVGNTKVLLVQLSLAHENVAAAWYSSMLLLLTGLVFVTCFFLDNFRFSHWFHRLLNIGWIMLGLVFFTLSFDELGSFHEAIGDTETFNSIEGVSGWEIFYYLIPVVGFLILAFGWLRLRNAPWALAFMILGVSLFVSIPFQEEFEINAMNAAADPASWKRPGIFLLIEEGSEVFGTLCFLISGLLYAISASTGKKRISLSENIRLKTSLTRNTLVKISFLFLAALGVLMLLLPYLMENAVRGDEGIPRNWFPAVMAFLTAIVAIFLPHKSGGSSKRKYIILSLSSLSISLYFGCNFYAQEFYGILRLAEILFLVVFVASTLYGGINIIPLIKNKIQQAGLLGWLLITYLALSPLGLRYSPELVFSGFAILFITLISARVSQKYETVPGQFKKLA